MTESIVNSGFTDVDKTHDPEFFIRHLDRLPASEQVRASKWRSLARLLITPGNLVLDVGCGTGDDAKALAEMVGLAGRVVGVDWSETMVDEATREAKSAHPTPDGTFDAGHVARVLHHVLNVDPIVA